MDTAAFIAAAESYLGTPFKHQGRLPGVGLDCAGLVVCAARAAGVEVRDVQGYGRIPRHGIFLRMVEEHCDLIALADLQDGDLLMFRWREEAQHLAIHIGGQLIHSWQGAGRAVRHDFDSMWRNRLTGCYRMRG